MGTILGILGALLLLPLLVLIVMVVCLVCTVPMILVVGGVFLAVVILPVAVIVWLCRLLFKRK